MTRCYLHLWWYFLSNAYQDHLPVSRPPILVNNQILAVFPRPSARTCPSRPSGGGLLRTTCCLTRSLCRTNRRLSWSNRLRYPTAGWSTAQIHSVEGNGCEGRLCIASKAELESVFQIFSSRLSGKVRRALKSESSSWACELTLPEVEVGDRTVSGEGDGVLRHIRSQEDFEFSLWWGKILKF